MKNNYIISIDLNKIYHNLESEAESESDSDNHSNNKFNSKTDSNSKSDLKNLILSHYNLDSYDFSNDIENFKELFLSKFDINHHDLILLDKTIYLNSYLGKNDKFTKYNKGIILIDLGMLTDSEIISNIDYLYENYQYLSLNKIYDNYLLYFNNKLDKVKDLANKKEIFNSKLYDIFYEDLLDLNLWQKIMDIPNKIHSEQMIKKLEDDFNYTKNIKQHTYESFYSGMNSKPDKDILSYEKSIFHDLKSDNYLINFLIESDQIKTIDKTKIHLILNKLNEYNNYIDNIMNDLKKINQNVTHFNHSNSNSNSDQKFDLRKDNNTNFSHIGETKTDADVESKSNNQQQSQVLKIIDPIELFNYSKINNLYMFLRSKSNESNINYIFNMSDVFDNKIEISQIINPTNSTNSTNKKKTILSSDEFGNSIVLFLNGLIKNKMKKLLKTYNLSHNETNILNHLKI